MSFSSQGYPVLKQPKKLDFIAQAAYRLHVKSGFTPEVCDCQLYGYLFCHALGKSYQVAAGTLRKIQTVLSAAAKRGYDAIVLSALGCGAFRNDPQEVRALACNSQKPLTKKLSI